MYHLYLYLFIVPKNQCKNMYIGLKQIAGKSMILFHVIWGLCFFSGVIIVFFWNWKYTRKNLQTFVGSGPKSCDSRSFGLMWPPFELAKEREIRADPSWMTFCFFGFTSTIPNYLLGGAALEADVLHGDLGLRSNSWSLYKCRPCYDPVGWCPRLTYKLVVLVGWTDSLICLLSACKKNRRT